MHREGTAARHVPLISIALMLAMASTILAGCGGAPAAESPNRAKVEVVAVFLVAGTNGDKAGVQAVLVNPDSSILDNITGASGTKATWRWDGDTAIVELGSEQVTLTVSDADPQTVIGKGTGGATVPFAVRLVDGRWKVDTALLESGADNAEKQSCFANQRTIEGAYQTAVASGEDSVSSVADLVGDYLKVQPVCPTTNLTYTLRSDGTVEACSAHGHY